MVTIWYEFRTVIKDFLLRCFNLSLLIRGHNLSPRGRVDTLLLLTSYEVILLRGVKNAQEYYAVNTWGGGRCLHRLHVNAFTVFTRVYRVNAYNSCHTLYYTLALYTRAPLYKVVIGGARGYRVNMCIRCLPRVRPRIYKG